MSDDDRSQVPGPPIFRVPSEPVEAGVAFSAEPSEPPLDDAARRFARAIASDVLLCGGEEAKAYRGGPLPAALAQSVREGYQLFVGRRGPGRARGFAAAVAELMTEHRMVVDAETVLVELGSDAATRDVPRKPWWKFW